MSVTTIEWTDRTWNPTRGCSRISPGCQNCYAERIASRYGADRSAGIDFAAEGKGKGPFAGFAIITPSGPRWTGKVELMPQKLKDPMHWKQPQRIFVNSMSDLFHENLPDSAIDRVFAIMQHAGKRKHTFQILTKRARRMREYFEAPDLYERWMVAVNQIRNKYDRIPISPLSNPAHFPLKHVWLGVSVENPPTADERIPELLRTPAVIRFVSYEPALEEVDLKYYLYPLVGTWMDGRIGTRPRLDWLITGGESGPGARPFRVQWARETIQQCKAAGVPVFVKQMGSRPIGESEADLAWILKMKDRKGGKMEEWREDLRVREFPR